jgi:hypothetical protein
MPIYGPEQSHYGSLEDSSPRQYDEPETLTAARHFTLIKSCVTVPIEEYQAGYEKEVEPALVTSSLLLTVSGGDTTCIAALAS